MMNKRAKGMKDKKKKMMNKRARNIEEQILNEKKKS